MHPAQYLGGSGATPTAAPPVPSPAPQAAAPQKTPGDGDRKIPRPMPDGIKVVHGKVPGPKNHLLTEPDGFVVDVDAKQIIANSLDEYKKTHAGQGGGGASGQPGRRGEAEAHPDRADASHRAAGPGRLGGRQQPPLRRFRRRGAGRRHGLLARPQSRKHTLRSALRGHLWQDAADTEHPDISRSFRTRRRV